MRITKLQLDKEEIKQIEALTNEVTQANKDIILAYDFSKDVYSLFKEKVNRRRIFKTFWQLFFDIKKQYTLFKVGDLMKNVEFYVRVKNFFKYFTFTALFRELNKLDSMEALEAFLNMFKPPQEQEGQGLDKQDKKQGGKQKDQKGMSADEGSLPIDMTKFKQEIPKIEKMLDSGLLNKEDFQDFLGKN